MFWKMSTCDIKCQDEIALATPSRHNRRIDGQHYHRQKCPCVESQITCLSAQQLSKPYLELSSPAGRRCRNTFVDQELSARRPGETPFPICIVRLLPSVMCLVLPHRVVRVLRWRLAQRRGPA